uniref:cytochrome b n=1 Tax=Thelohanellus kitauei TaxID=669202 RepID=UPI003002D04F
MFLTFLERKLWWNLFFYFPTTISFSIWWNLGFLLLLFIFFQVVSGIFLSCFINIGSFCLTSKFLIFKEIVGGWFLVIFHIITPWFIFFFLYLHILKSLLFPTYSVLKLWSSGVIIFLLFIIIVFSGYSIVYGSMSYWAITVVSELIKFIFGEKISSIIFYNTSGISEITLFKIFTFHYFFSLLVFVFIFLHIYILHNLGSSFSIHSYCSCFSFSLLLFIKDLCIGLFLLIISIFFVCFIPEIFMSGEGNMTLDKVDYVEISVEWYLRIFFILLRSFSSKFLGAYSTILLVLLLLLYLFFRNIWGIQRCVNFWLITFLTISVVVYISFYFFSSSLFLIPFLLVILFNLIFIQPGECYQSYYL